MTDWGLVYFSASKTPLLAYRAVRKHGPDPFRTAFHCPTFILLLFFYSHGSEKHGFEYIFGVDRIRDRPRNCSLASCRSTVGCKRFLFSHRSDVTGCGTNELRRARTVVLFFTAEAMRHGTGVFSNSTVRLGKTNRTPLDRTPKTFQKDTSFRPPLFENPPGREARVSNGFLSACLFFWNIDLGRCGKGLFRGHFKTRLRQIQYKTRRASEWISARISSPVFDPLACASRLVLVLKCPLVK